jgi:hypothetical protein|tara:strand:- start:1632 stop:1937 length:306 start_codon:yes stop_codon:yes gene_type:complete
MLDRETTPGEQDSFGVRIKINEAERFLAKVKEDPDLQLIFRILDNAKLLAAEAGLGRPSNVSDEELHYSRGQYCLAKALLSIPSDIQANVDRFHNDPDSQD